MKWRLHIFLTPSQDNPGFFRKMKPVGWTEIYTKICHQGLPPGITQTDLLPTSLMSRKGNGEVLAQPKGQRTMAAKTVGPTLSPKAQEPGTLVSKGRRWRSQIQQRTNSILLCFLILLSRSQDGHSFGLGWSSLTWLTEMLSSFRNTFLHPERVHYHLSWHPFGPADKQH